MLSVRMLDGFQPQNAPELVNLGVVEGIDGVNLAATLCTTDDRGARMVIEVGFAAMGAPRAAWLADEHGTRIWSRGAHRAAVQAAVDGVVSSALTLFAQHQLGAVIGIVRDRAYAPAPA